jgi:isocitrate dehydrogenase (NAD+)
MLSGVMLLRHIGEADAAGRLEAAIADVVREGREVTYDLRPGREHGGAAGTSGVADAVIAKLRVPAGAR